MNRRIIISHKMKAFQTTCTKSFGGLFAALLGLCFISTAHAQIFVSDFNDRIGEYTTSGATVNAALVTGLNDPQGIAVEDVPEPSTWAMVLGGLGLLALRLRTRRTVV